jgi:hypothetical protein
MIFIKYVVESLDMGIVVHKNNIWKNCETLQLQDNNNMPYIYTFYHSEEREIHRYNFFIKTSLYQGNILGFFKTKGGVFWRNKTMWYHFRQWR